jgi:hypothetical protein
MDHLTQLAVKGTCAGDTYYFNLDQATFDRVMEGSEEEDFYRIHVRRRTLGVEAFKAETARELAALSGAQLDQLVRQNIHGHGAWLLMQILAHPQCEFATALRIYWALLPNYQHAQYDSLEAAIEQNKGSVTIQLLIQIEQQTRLGNFARTLPAPDRDTLNDLLEENPPDYAKDRYAKIPPELRI